MNCRQSIWLPGVVLGFAALISCQPSSDWHASDANYVAIIVARFADASNDKETLRQLYADGAFPNEQQLTELRRYMPKTRAAEVDVDGDTATAEVMFEITASGEQLGPQVWTVVRAGDAWKLKDTPPPQRN